MKNFFFSSFAVLIVCLAIAAGIMMMMKSEKDVMAGVARQAEWEVCEPKK